LTLLARLPARAERPYDASMLAIYDNMNIRFAYPENWVVDEDIDEMQVNSVTVQSPSGAFWTVSVHSRGQKTEELNQTVLTAMKDEYEDFEAEAIQEQIDKTMAAGHEMYFYCLDFVVRARLRTFHRGSQTLLTLCQAEDREFEQLLPVFSAITETLIDPDKIPADT